jgi:hypothetical protein
MIASLEPELLARLTRLDDPNGTAEAEALDNDLATAVRRTAFMRRLFYAAVLVVALYGTATGAVAAFGLPWWIAFAGVFALELGGVTFLSNADIRRRLGEPAAASRLLGASIAGAAATFNIVTHGHRLLGGFFALMSMLGFLAWWLDVENKRHDRLRAQGLLPPPTPKYGLWAHWTRHPIITGHARSLAKAHPRLGLYGSLEAALIVRRREQRNAALADALRSRIRRAAGKKMAQIAVLTYDMDEVARRLRANADYHGLTALLASELTAEHLLHGRDYQTAAATRAWLIRHRQTPVLTPDAAPAGSIAEPKAAAGTVPTEPAAVSAERAVLADVQAPPTSGQPVSAPGSSRRPPDTRGEGRQPSPGGTVNGKARPVNAAGPSTALPARRPTGRAVTITVAEPPNGRPARPATPAPPRAPVRTSTEPGDNPDPHPRRRVRVNVLGEPAILDADGKAIRGVRAKSLELLVFLAVHRGGVAVGDILDAVWPDVLPPRANQRLSTCLSNLRSVVRRALQAADPDDVHADGARPEPIVNSGGRYHLDPAIVTVDWWRLLDEQDSGPTPVTDEYFSAAAALIADGYDLPWLDNYRDTSRIRQPTPPSDLPRRQVPRHPPHDRRVGVKRPGELM